MDIYHISREYSRYASFCSVFKKSDKISWGDFIDLFLFFLVYLILSRWFMFFFVADIHVRNCPWKTNGFQTTWVHPRTISGNVFWATAGVKATFSGLN